MGRIARVAVAVLGVVFVLPAGAHAADRFVDPAGSDAANDCLTLATPCKTVTHGVSAAVSGDEVVLAAGTYSEDSIDVDKTLTIRGATPGVLPALRPVIAGPDTDNVLRALGAALTLRDVEVASGTGGGSAVEVGTAGSLIADGATMRAGSSGTGLVAGGDAGAVTVDNSAFPGVVASDFDNGVVSSSAASVTVEDSTFSNLDISATTAAGGTGLLTLRRNAMTGIRGVGGESAIQAGVGGLIAEENTLSADPLDNSDLSKAGIRATTGPVTMRRNVIAGMANRTAVDLSSQATPVSMFGDVLVNNKRGITAFALSAPVNARNVTVAGNSSRNLEFTSAQLNLNSSLVGDQGSSADQVGTCTAVFSRGPAAACGFTTPPNTTAPPLFVNLPGGNWHLQTTSTLVDAGDGTTALGPGQLSDVDGDPRAVSGPGASFCNNRPDIGADEVFPGRDCIPPVVTLNGSVSGQTATFTFSAPEPVTFSCSLDGAAFAACSSPSSFSGLVGGSHVFSVVGSDAAGNEADPVTSQVEVVPVSTGPSGKVKCKKKQKLKKGKCVKKKRKKK